VKAGAPEAVLSALGARLVADDVCWLLVFEWRRDLLAGASVASWGTDERTPSAAALTSWFVREADTDEPVLVADGAELGTVGRVLAAPAGDAYLVLGCRRLRPYVCTAAGEMARVATECVLRERSDAPALAAVG